MLARCTSAAIVGVEACPVVVEADLGPGLPAFQIVGLPDTAVQESRERIRSALRNSGQRPLVSRLTVNLAPAALRKQGPSFDLPMALALQGAAGRIPLAWLEGLWATGELGLDGSLRPVRGVLAMAEAAMAGGARHLLVPKANGAEAVQIDGLSVLAAADLNEAQEQLNNPQTQPAPDQECFSTTTDEFGFDLRDLQGQSHGRRALEIAAAGGHHMLLVGPPGCGKSVLARCLPDLLPPLSMEEALAVRRVHSVAFAQPEAGLRNQRPFRAPHHTTIVVPRRPWWGAAHPTPCPVKSAWLITGSCFLTSCRNLAAIVWTTCGNPWNRGPSTSPGPGSACASPASFNWWRRPTPAPVAGGGIRCIWTVVSCAFAAPSAAPPATCWIALPTVSASPCAALIASCGWRAPLPIWRIPNGSKPNTWRRPPPIGVVIWT